MQPKLCAQVVAFITSLLLRIHESQASFVKPGCQEMCGNVTILYPFGIGAGCYLSKSFEVLCDESSHDYPLRFANKQNFPILELSTNLVRVFYKSTQMCGSQNATLAASWTLNGYFSFSQDHNRYVAVGCSILASFWVDPSSQSTCTSSCLEKKTCTATATATAGGCNGLNGCCQHSMLESITSYNYSIKYNTMASSCAFAFISEKSALIPTDAVKVLYSSQKDVPILAVVVEVPVSLNWVISRTTCHNSKKTGDNLCGRNSHCNDLNGLGYNCHCKKGYEGNPYLPNGCQNVNDSCPKQSNHYCEEGETCVYKHGSYKCISRNHPKWNVSATLEIIIGLSAFGVIGYLAYIKLNSIRKNKIRKKLYKQNGGPQLKQQISSTESRVMIIKVYTAEEMKKATKKFCIRRFLGKGGQGTVYKGLLPDGTIVAVKKLNVMDVKQVARFVNEVFILAQINHQNIVKLLGCCLDYEVPLLVYEYLENDTLSQHLHDGTVLANFTWKDRIRIAREVARALAYLHSYASPSVIHRDIKPGNILLDNDYKAVVADFGLSRLVPLNRSHVTTQADGTFGYVDPEYFQTGKLTVKSDVYSFGVVLTELLTRKKSISSSDSGEGLVPRFKYLVKHNRFDEILDKQVMQEATMDDVLLVAKIAKRCMKSKSKKRPSMEEVVADLDKLGVVQFEFPDKYVLEREITAS